MAGFMDKKFGQDMRGFFGCGGRDVDAVSMRVPVGFRPVGFYDFQRSLGDVGMPLRRPAPE